MAKDLTEVEMQYKYKGNGSFEPSIPIERYLYEIIKIYGPITRSKLRKLTGIPRTTIYDCLIRLLLQKRIRKFPIHSKKPGRPRIFYEVIRENVVPNQGFDA
ncbi:MAG: hypothetical protein ACTSYB_04405 [Candidatus Helarchaeota archaeon]